MGGIEDGIVAPGAMTELEEPGQAAQPAPGSPAKPVRRRAAMTWEQFYDIVEPLCVNLNWFVYPLSPKSVFVALLLFPARLYNRAGNKRAMTLFSSRGCRYAEETCGPRQPESLAPIVPLLEVLHRDKLETLGHVEALGWPRGPTRMGHLHRCPVSLDPGAGA